VKGERGNEVSIFAEVRNLLGSGKENIRSIAADLMRAVSTQNGVGDLCAARDLGEVIWTMDRNMRFTHISPRVEKMLGYGAEEAVNLGVGGLLTPASLEAARVAFLEKLAGGKGVRRDWVSSWVLRLEASHKSGLTVWTENTVMPIRNRQGRFLGIEGITRLLNEHRELEGDHEGTAFAYRGLDSAETGSRFGNQIALDEIRRLEDDLRRSRQLNQLLLEGLPHPAMLIGADRTVLAANRLARDGGVQVGELYEYGFAREGCLTEESAGLGGGSRSTSQDGTECAFPFADEASLLGQPVSDEVSAFGRLWDARWIPIERDVTLHYAIDITERRQMEEQLEGLSEQGARLRLERQTEVNKRIDFIRALVHELKTPLTSVMASGELLAAELQEGPLLRLTKNLNRGAQNLNNRIDELLDLAKGELGMLHLKSRNVEVLQLLHEAVDEMTPVASANGQTLILNVPPSLPSVQGDEERLKQIVLVLLNNAVKWTPVGEKIVLRAIEKEKSLVLAVRDTGPGIAKQEMEYLFEPFYQAEHDKKCISGLGLGLALCKILVELHSGRIWAESQIGKGSTFSFSLPL